MNYNPLTTETAIPYSELDSIDTKAVIVRDESYITNTASGTVVPIADDGKRVARGDNVALVFADEASAKNHMQIERLEKEIEYYKLLKNKSEVGVADAKLLYSEIEKSVEKCILIAQSGEYEELSDAGAGVAEGITARQIALGTKLNFDEKINQLSSELAALKASPGGTSVISAPVSGYYISESDGYETLIDYNKINALTPAEVEKALAAEASQLPAGVMGKIVGRFAWYMVCTVPAAETAELQRDMAVKVRIPDSPVGEVKAEVYKLIEGEDGKNVVIIRAADMSEEIAHLRFENIQIVRNEYDGFRIPNDAIRAEDGEKGVYVLAGNKIRFRKINIIYSAEDYCIAENKGEPGYLKLYDEIITEGKDLYDGKVVG